MRRKLFVAGLAIAAIAVAGCAPVNDEVDGASGKTITQGISSDKVVNLGAFVSQSGPLSFAASIGWGTALKLDEINAAGGINGYTFDYTMLDDGSDAARSATLARELWEDQKVFSLLMPYGSAQLEASMTYLSSNNVPVLFPFAGPQQYAPEGVLADENIFGFSPSYASLINQMLNLVHDDHDVKRIAVVYTNNDFGEEGIDAARSVASALGLEITETIGYNWDETNLAPMGRRIASSDAQAVVLWSNLPSAIQIISSAVNDGYDGLWLTNTVFMSEAAFEKLITVPGLDERVFISIPIQQPNSGTADTVEYVEKFTKAHPDGDLVLGRFGWAAASIFEEGVARATAGGKDLTWEGLKEVLLGMTDESLGGAEGVTYSQDTRVGTTKAQPTMLKGGEMVAVGEFIELIEPGDIGR